MENYSIKAILGRHFIIKERLQSIMARFFRWLMYKYTDYGRLVKKSPSLHGRKSTPTPKILGTAEAYFVWHIGPNFQIFLIYALIGCPYTVKGAKGLPIGAKGFPDRG